MDEPDYVVSSPTEPEIAKIIWPYGENMGFNIDQTIQSGRLFLQCNRMGQMRIIKDPDSLATMGIVSWYLSDYSSKPIFESYDISSILERKIPLDRGDFCYVSEISLAMSAIASYRVARKLIRETGASVLAYHDRRGRWRERKIREWHSF